MKTILFITNSPGKVEEAQAILGNQFKIKLHKFDLDEIQTINGKDVIRKKAREAYNLIKKPVIVEDTSLYFDAWNGLPGALVRWFLDSVGCKGICSMMSEEKDRKAYAESAIAYFNGRKVKVVAAKLEGKIPQKPAGDKGFGWDPIFIPKGYSQTFAQMGQEEKNKISMRKQALEKLRNYLS
jgi:non-canonical purine NTP pyrophosphatase (RdgB/HAM1 family)